MTKARFIPLLLFLLDFGTRLIFSGSQSISGDEAFSAFHAQAGIHTIIAQLSHGNNPPLYEILLHYWIAWFGISAFALRFLSVLFTSLTVVFIYLIGLRFFSLRVALVAALLFTFSDYQMFFAHEARVYPLFELLAAVSMYAFLSLTTGRRPLFYFTMMTLAAVIASYAHFFSFFILFIQIACTICFSRLRRTISPLIVCAALIALVCYIPYAAIFWERFTVSGRSGTWLHTVPLAAAYDMVRFFANQPVPAVIFLIILALALVRLFYHRHSYTSLYGSIIAIWFILPFTLMFLLSWDAFPVHVPMFLDRYLIFTSLPFFLLIAIAADYISRTTIFHIPALILVVALMLCTFTLDPDNRLHIAEASHKVIALKTPQTIVYIHPWFFNLNFAYYYDHAIFRQVTPGAGDIYFRLNNALRSENVFPISHLAEIDTARCDRAPRIIYFDMLPDPVIDSFLDHRYGRSARYFYPMLSHVVIYDKITQ